MPRTSKFQREDIINTAYEIVKKEGFSAINVRRIAKELGCSIQPIFHNFATMEELNKEVFDKIYKKYQYTMKNAIDKEHPYLAKGIAYIKFAKEYPEFYKIIFMQESKMNIDEFIQADIEVTENVMESILKKFDISEEDIKKFHIQVWVYSHGLACLVATKTVNFSDDEIKEQLLNTVQQLFRGYKKGD